MARSTVNGSSTHWKKLKSLSGSWASNYVSGTAMGISHRLSDKGRQSTKRSAPDNTISPLLCGDKNVLFPALRVDNILIEEGKKTKGSPFYFMCVYLLSQIVSSQYF